MQHTVTAAANAPIRRNTLGRVTDAIANATGKRFCSHHQGEVFLVDGSYVVRGRSKRFMCNACQAKGKRK